jgi:hypothetical protein
VNPEPSRRCECGGTAPVVASALSAGELPRRLPEGTVWTHRCTHCGDEFQIHPLVRVVGFQALLATLVAGFAIRGMQTPDRVAGRALLFLSLVLIGWLARLAWVTAFRLRERRKYPRIAA